MSWAKLSPNASYSSVHGSFGILSVWEHAVPSPVGPHRDVPNASCVAPDVLDFLSNSQGPSGSPIWVVGIQGLWCVIVAPGSLAAKPNACLPSPHPQENNFEQLPAKVLVNTQSHLIMVAFWDVGGRWNEKLYLFWCKIILKSKCSDFPHKHGFF